MRPPGPAQPQTAHFQPAGHGALQGIRVIELGGIGPIPFAGMMLGDMGAEVIRIDRPGAKASLTVDNRVNAMLRGRRTIELDLRTPEGHAVAVDLLSESDAVIEGFRPGVTERLNLGPADCFAVNPALVYGRATGWGRTGPLAMKAGHDINYLGHTGVLDAIGCVGGPPVVPLNLIGDFAGGGLLLAYGVVCAVLEARSSGLGQVVDNAMIDGISLLATAIQSLRGAGLWADGRGMNVENGGAPFYGVYRTGDDRYLAVGAVEPQFYQAFVKGLGLDEGELPPQHDRAGWPTLRQIFAERIASRTSEEWMTAFADVDACVSEVLSFTESVRHPHSLARDAFVHIEGIAHPAPSPRLSRTPGVIGGAPVALGA
jgi:alpha-methylacyl-CoA racemase